MTANTKTVTKPMGDLFIGLLYGLACAEERAAKEQEIKRLADGRLAFTATDLIGEDYFRMLLKTGFPKDMVLRFLNDMTEWPRYYQERYSAEYAAFKAKRAPKPAPRERLRVVK